MSEGSILEKTPKFPISNYDIVVYFGVGISTLPFVYRYFLASSGAILPPVFGGYADEIVNRAVSLISLAFAVYIVGHGIAILSSMFIEQFLYRSAGPPSNIIVNAAKPTFSVGGSFREDLRMRLKDVYSHPRPADLVRLIYHAPAMPVYILMYIFQVHGFYETKLNSFVILRTQKRLEHCFDFSDTILTNVKWFKIVEYACANDHPVATAKMYNYMVIYGLFRSTAFLLLCSIWLEIFYYFYSGGLGFIDHSGHGRILVRLFILYGGYFVSFIGFAKFTRRYTEEALQAFALSKTFETN